MARPLPAEPATADATGLDHTATPPRILQTLLPIDVLAIALAFLLPVAFSPVVGAPPFTPKLAVLICAIPVGLPRLFALASRSPVALASRCLIAFLAISMISVAFSKDKLLGIFGFYTFGTAAIYFVAFASLWAIGVSVAHRPHSRDLIGTAVLFAALLNAIVGVLQFVNQHDVILPNALAIPPGSGSSGLMENPAYLGGLLSIAYVYCLARGAAAPLWLRSSPFILGIGLAMSAERAPIALVIGAAIAVPVIRRLRASSVAAFAGLAGYIGGVAITSYSGLGTPAIHSRIAAAPANILSQRLDIWGILAHQIPSHLLLGFGPGETMVAVTPHTTLALALTGAVPDGIATDAHNIVIDLLTTTGLPGLLSMAAFLALCIARSRGPLLGISLATLAFAMFEPQMIGLTPIMYLALGAAHTASPVAQRQPAHGVMHARTWPRVCRITTILLWPICLAASVDLLVGDYAMYASNQAIGTFHESNGHISFPKWPFQLANTLLPFWPDSANQYSKYYAYLAINGHPSLWPEDWKWQHIAVDRQPENPIYWSNYGRDLAKGRHYGEARQAFLEAYRDDPWWADALSNLGLLALQDRDYCSASFWLEKLLTVLPSLATASGRASLASISAKCAHLRAGTHHHATHTGSRYPPVAGQHGAALRTILQTG